MSAADGILTTTEHAGRERPDLLADILAGRIADAPLSRHLGFRLTAFAAGRATFAAEPSPLYRNPMGTMHGGWTTSILDSAMGYAVFSTLAPDETFTTLELKTSFARPVRGDVSPLAAEGVVLTRGRKVVLAEARMTDPAGRLLAHATSTCLVLPAG